MRNKVGIEKQKMMQAHKRLSSLSQNCHFVIRRESTVKVRVEDRVPETRKQRLGIEENITHTVLTEEETLDIKPYD